MAKMHLSPDFKEFLELLNKHDVRFIVVGGYAVGFHGYVRYTGDLDIWISTDQTNAERTLLALREFGFSSLDIELNDLTKKDFVIQLGQPPYGLIFSHQLLHLISRVAILKLNGQPLMVLKLSFLT